jgi:hypothetical protein
MEHKIFRHKEIKEISILRRKTVTVSYNLISHSVKDTVRNIAKEDLTHFGLSIKNFNLRKILETVDINVGLRQTRKKENIQLISDQVNGEIYILLKLGGGFYRQDTQRYGVICSHTYPEMDNAYLSREANRILDSLEGLSKSKKEFTLEGIFRREN